MLGANPNPFHSDLSSVGRAFDCRVYHTFDNIVIRVSLVRFRQVGILIVFHKYNILNTYELFFITYNIKIH